MTEDQNLLARYLIDLKAPMTCGLFIVGCMETEEMIMEMFKYIVDHPEAEYHELYLFACKLASKYGILDDCKKESEDDTVES